MTQHPNDRPREHQEENVMADAPAHRTLGTAVARLTAGRRALRTRITETTSEPALSEWYAGYVAGEDGPLRHVARRPGATLAALAAIARLPRLRAELPDDPAGRFVHRTLTRPGPLRTPFGSTGVAVLDIPADGAEYSLGASKQTLRRKARKAQKRGVTCRPVDDPAQRRELLARADQAEIDHVDEQYRSEQPDNSDLLDHDLWLVAVDADGEPLMLSVTPIAGDWGQLRHFRTLGRSDAHSDARYLMTQVLVETLSARGIRYLVEGTHPAELSNGLRHFQRMVGFRLVRVFARLVPAGPAAAPAAPADTPVADADAEPAARVHAQA